MVFKAMGSLIESEFGDAVNIVEWVRVKIRTKAGIVEALDCNVGASCSSVQEEMLLVLRIALLCTSTTYLYDTINYLPYKVVLIL